MMFQCWPTLFDAGPTLKQHRVNDPCLLGISYQSLGCGRGDIFSFLLQKRESSSFNNTLSPAFRQDVCVSFCLYI